MDACRASLRGGSRSFHLASRVLPRSVRDPATVLYAFCREADDAVDLVTDRLVALDALRERLRAIYAGRPHDNAADRALADVVARFAIPRELLDALLEGFEWDALGRRYRSMQDLNAYAARVAGVVGVIVALLMGVRRADVLARAGDLGVAMQLTNIARDVGEDARVGRLYLPEDWLEQAGIDPDGFLEHPAFSPALATVIERVLAAADELYRRSESGIAALPAGSRPGIRAARLLYAEIGREVARRGFDSVSQRAIVSPWRQSRLLLDSLAAALDARPASPEPALAETRFLVEAAMAAGPVGARIGASPQTVAARLEQRIAWLIDLFERLERDERGAILPVRAGMRIGALD